MNGRKGVVIYLWLVLQAFAVSGQQQFEPERGITFEAGGGYSYLTFVNNSGNKVLDEHNDQLKNAYHLRLSAGYYLSEDWLLSISGSILKSQAFTDNIIATTSTGDTVFGYLEDNLTISTVGAVIEQNLYDGSGMEFNYFFGIDVFYYEVNGRFVTDDFELTGTDIDFRLGLNGFIPLESNLSLGLQAQYTSGVLNSPDFTNFGGNFALSASEQDASRLEISAVLRYYIFKNKKREKRKVPQPDSEDEYVPSRFQ